MTKPIYSATHENKKSNMIWASEDSPETTGVYLFEIDKLTITKENWPDLTRHFSRTVGGPAFLVGLYENQFYHFLTDGIAQYLYLKTFIPDLKIYFINDQPSEVKNLDHLKELKVRDFIKNVVAWCQEETEFGGEIINFVKYKNITFDKLFIFGNSNITFLRDLIDISSLNENGEMVPVDISNNEGTRLLMMPLLKDFMYSKALEHNRLPSDFIYPERVYIRPGLTINRMQAWQEQINFLKNNGVVFNEEMKIIDDPNNALNSLLSSDEFEHTILGIGDNLRGQEQELAQRYLSPAEVQELDDFFARRDYFSLDSESMAWIDMLNMIIKATHVAFVSGAGILNALVASDEAQIIYINPNTTYDFDHQRTLEIFFQKVPPLLYYDRKKVRVTRHNVSKLLKNMEQEVGDYL